MISANGYRYAKDKFTKSIMINRTISIYKHELKNADNKYHN
jgi:hypothetical protein